MNRPPSPYPYSNKLSTIIESSTQQENQASQGQQHEQAHTSLFEQILTEIRAIKKDIEAIKKTIKNN